MCDKLAKAKTDLEDEATAHVETLEQLRHLDRLRTVATPLVGRGARARHAVQRGAPPRPEPRGRRGERRGPAGRRSGHRGAGGPNEPYRTTAPRLFALGRSEQGAPLARLGALRRPSSPRTAREETRRLARGAPGRRRHRRRRSPPPRAGGDEPRHERDRGDAGGRNGGAPAHDGRRPPVRGKISTCGPRGSTWSIRARASPKRGSPGSSSRSTRRNPKAVGRGSGSPWSRESSRSTAAGSRRRAKRDTDRRSRSTFLSRHDRTHPRRRRRHRFLRRARANARKARLRSHDLRRPGRSARPRPRRGTSTSSSRIYESAESRASSCAAGSRAFVPTSPWWSSPASARWRRPWRPSAPGPSTS
jgi:hypothetical protein